MHVGVPKETKTHEYRVGLVPASVRELVHAGHVVFVETNAGMAIGFDDDAYRATGATVLEDAAAVFGAADMIIKVKEPQPPEVAMLREGQVLFTYLHLAPAPDLTRGLMDSGAIAIAYETVTAPGGGLPLLAPMSEVAGRMAIQVGAHCLEKEQGGAGVLLGGVPGTPGARVTVIGGGVVGSNAVRMAVGCEARVTVLDRALTVLDRLDRQYGAALNTVFATRESVDAAVVDADLVIGAVLVPGAAAPRLVDRSQVARMRRGSVMVDVAIDQGGCFETSRPTSHADPTFVEEGVVHYCVTNMPGAVARTSAVALNNATLPFVLALANDGTRRALAEDAHLRAGLNVHTGAVTHKAVADALELPFRAAEEAIGI